MEEKGKKFKKMRQKKEEKIERKKNTEKKMKLTTEKENGEAILSQPRIEYDLNSAETNVMSANDTN